MYFTLLLMVENNVADLSCVVVPCKDFRYSKFNCKENFLFPKISFNTFTKNGLQRFHNILNHFESKFWSHQKVVPLVHIVMTRIYIPKTATEKVDEMSLMI